MVFLYGMNYFLIALCLLFLLSIGFLKTKKILNPLSVIGLMWLSLLVLSLQSLGGMFVPSNVTVYLVLGACMSMAVGAMLSSPKIKRNNELINSRERLLHIVFLLFCILPIGVALLNFLYIVLSKGYIHYVYLTRIDGVDRAASAGSSFNSMFLAKLTRPVLYFYTFTAIANLIRHGNKIMIKRSLFCMLALSVIFTSRADMLVLFVTLGLFIVSEVGGNGKRPSFAKKFSKLQLGVLFFLMTMVFLWLSQTRAGSKETYEMLIHYVVNYHTAGFVLFDIAYNNHDSFFYSINGYGLISFSTIGFILQQLDKFLGVGFYIPGLDFREQASFPVSIGTFMGVGNKDYELNAFYTFMGPVFTDFGTFGIFIFAFVYGYFLMQSYQTYKLRGETYSLGLLLFLLWSGYNALLQSAISTDYYWIICLLFVFFNRVRISRI